MYICIMIELLKHIESLLLENDCVIIPTFGGFVSHYTPARWIDEEGLFLPPTRTIGFNPQLKMNDGLLVQSYMTAYCTDFSDASKLVDKAVKELISNLHEEGKVEMHGIGDMYFTIHGTLQFQPYEDGLLTPYLYGLNSFEIDKLDHKVKVEEENIETDIRDPKVYEIRVNRSFLRASVAVAAAVILFFFMSTPVENTYVEKSNYAQLIPSELLESFNNKIIATKTGSARVSRINNDLKSSQLALIDNSNSSNKEATVLQKNQELLKPKAVKEVTIPKQTVEKKKTSVTTLVKPTTASVNKSSYYIITASVANRADAQEIVNRLRSKGYSGATYIEGNKRIRVSIMSFSDNVEANNKLCQLKKNAIYKDAWVLANK
ncbi:SPOR domain-containing protein [uncultured Bacteroides sp.]|uniref:HU domain-containing protein n=1 Tax=uncultured Bacteroides sp. TaxID=162156 RepID=UPI002AAB43B0|nr:SPOR domain-containing protein [uncultured Bacteroides sp.]